MKIITIVLIVCGILTCGNCQKEEFKPYHKEYQVIAKSGLNLRAKPNTQSNIFTKIPQMAFVQLLHRDAYGMEKFGSIKTDKMEYKVEGYWIKVRYKEFEGFLNTAFLIPNWNYYTNDKSTKLDSINKEWVILVPGSDCSPNVYPYHEYQWFGLYLLKDSTYSFEPIEFEFIRNLNEMADFHIVAKKEKNLQYIIGSKEHRLIASNGYNNGRIPAYAKKKPIDTLESVFVKDFIEVRTKSSEKTNRKGEHYFSLDYSKVFLVRNTTKQKISEWGAMVYWTGDINGDGIQDYIISSGEYTMELWMGTTDENKVAIKKAVYFGAPCC